MHNLNSPFPRGIESKFPGERGMKIRQIPRGIGDGDPRGGNPTPKFVISAHFLFRGASVNYDTLEPHLMS